VRFSCVSYIIMLCVAVAMRTVRPGLKRTRRGVHYVFNPGCYFRMINAKYNIHIIINTKCSLCIATDILYNNHKYNTECFMHLLNDTVFLHIYRNNKRTLSLWLQQVMVLLGSANKYFKLWWLYYIVMWLHCMIWITSLDLLCTTSGPPGTQLCNIE
jgi:hypothetical protein